jgi:DNA-binding NtrC family response regulator
MALILCVDDETTVSGILKSLLESHGHQVLTAQNAVAALELIRTKDLDLVISDIRMAPMNGIELLRHIRRDHPSLPVIMLTAYASAETAKVSKQLKASAYLTKPFTNEDVLAAVDRALIGHKDQEAKGAGPQNNV